MGSTIWINGSKAELEADALKDACEGLSRLEIAVAKMLVARPMGITATELARALDIELTYEASGEHSTWLAWGVLKCFELDHFVRPVRDGRHIRFKPTPSLTTYLETHVFAGLRGRGSAQISK